MATFYRAYRVLLAAVPRHFRLRYWQEMAMGFCDLGQDADRSGRSSGRILVWTWRVTDHSDNIPDEPKPMFVDQVVRSSVARRCVGCNNKLPAGWPRCLCCGTFLTASTTDSTHMTRVSDSWERSLAILADQAPKIPPSLR
jgi:hypothetical protein